LTRRSELVLFIEEFLQGDGSLRVWIPVPSAGMEVYVVRGSGVFFEVEVPGGSGLFFEFDSMDQECRLEILDPLFIDGDRVEVGDGEPWELWLGKGC